MVQKQKMCKGKRLAALFTALVLFIGLLPTVSIALPEQTSEVFALSGTDIPEPLSAEQLAQHGAVQRLRGEEPDEYTFVFLNSDGTRTSYSYGVPVKYIDENGAVRDKNNTIKDFNNEYGNLDSDVQLRFPKKLNAVKISYKNRQVQIKPVTDMAPGHINAEVLGNTVTYANAFGEGMDLRYASTMNGVKEDIILRSNTGVNSFSFEVKTGGLALKELDGEWCVADGDRKIFGFGDLDVTDSFTGEDEATDDWDAHSTTASISVQTVQENNKYVVTLSVDEAFLNAPTTVYPVYVDPSFNVESSYIQDTYISQGSPNANYGTGKDLKLGYGASSKSNRVLVKFKNWVGSESRPGLDMTTVVSAKYYMYCTTTYTSTPYVDAYMVPLESAEWMDTGATWNNAAASTLNTSLLNGSTKVGSAGWYNFDVTNAYKAWWSALKSRGLLFKMRVESATENYYRHFASANYTADSKKLPYLAVQYGAEGMLISPTSADMTVGQTKQISTSIYPTSIDQQVTWTSSNPDVAEVSSSGLVTAKKTGSTTITARAVKNSAVYATCNIRVKDTVSSIYLQYSKYLGEQGESFTLSYELSPSDAYANVVWTSSNTSIATVDCNGIVTIVGNGNADITVKDNITGKSAVCKITTIGPSQFIALRKNGAVLPNAFNNTEDGFYVCTKPIGQMLNDKGITYVIGADGSNHLPTMGIYDDWYLYAIQQSETNYVYGLLKMREQEFDSDDGNDPGVTISFIEFQVSTLQSCLLTPFDVNRSILRDEIRRVVESKDRSETQYHEVLKNYFKNAASSGAYLVAEMYCEFIASLPNSGDGMIDTPNKFNELEFGSDSYKRVRGALSDINDKAGKKVFDFLHDRVMISSESSSLSLYEKQAILATHTGNQNFNSFAAEVVFHARALESVLASLDEWYRSAIRADMAIGEEESYAGQYWTDYYDLDSPLVLEQVQYHGEK